MKIRYLLSLLFVLILPLTLYFTLPNYRTQNSSKLIKSSSNKQHFLPIQEWTTENGIKVLWVETKEIPMVDIEVSFDAGSARDGIKPGLSHLCANLLSEGAAGLNADTIAKKFEDVGANYNTKVDRDRIKISLRSLIESPFLTPTIELFSTLISEPDFPEDNILTLKNKILMELKRTLQKPHVIAKNAFYKAIYLEHPYAHPILGTEQSITSITKKDLIDFHQKFFVANNATISMVGDLSREHAIELSQIIARKLLSGNKADKLPEVSPLKKPIKQYIAFSSEQAHVLLGEPCAIEGDPDYFALTIGNYILGGNPLTSHLFKEVRDKHGLAYQVGSTLLLLKHPGPFVITLQTKSDQTQEAIKLLEENLLLFLKEGPTDKEVADAKKGIIRSIPLEVNTNSKIKNFISSLGFYNLPLDFLETYSEHLEAITTTEVKNAFQRRIRPGNMALIVVGNSSP